MRRFNIYTFYHNDLYCRLFYKSLEKYDVKVIYHELDLNWFLNNREKIDFVHFHWPEFYYSSPQKLTQIYLTIKLSIFLLVIKFFNKKIIWTAHNAYPHNVIEPNFIEFISRLSMVLFANLIFVHSATSKGIITKNFPFSSNKICVIKHGNYINYYLNDITFFEARRSLKINKDAYIYLFIGACKPYKGLETLIEAFRRVEGEKNVLLIVGHFLDKAYYEKISNSISKKYKEKKDIILIDKYIPDHEIQYYLNASNVLVLPYRNILTSGTALLGLSFGIPIIAPQKGFFVDLIENNSLGLLYDGTSVKDLARKMHKIKSLKFSKKQIIKHTRKFDWNEVGKSSYGFLLKLVS